MEQKFDKYMASRLPDAKQLARDKGHTEEPVYAYCGGGIWTVFYKAASQVTAQPRRRFAISTQHQILKELKQA